MEIIIFAVIILIIIFFNNVSKFNKRMMDIEIEGYKIFSENDLVKYRDYLMCQIIKKYPNLSNKDRVKTVIEVIRNAHIGNNKDYLNGLNETYQYVFFSYMERIKEIEKNPSYYCNNNYLF